MKNKDLTSCSGNVKHWTPAALAQAVEWIMLNAMQSG